MPQSKKMTEDNVEFHEICEYYIVLIDGNIVPTQMFFNPWNDINSAVIIGQIGILPSNTFCRPSGN